MCIQNMEHRRSACDLIDLHGRDAHAPWSGDSWPMPVDVGR